MWIKRISLFSFILGTLILGVSQQASASTVDGDDEESLPSGVERYYPKNPDSLVEYYPDDLRTLTTYGINPSFPKSVFLTTDLKTASTKRIYVKSPEKLVMALDFHKFGKRGTIVYTLFRYGEYYKSYVAYDTGDKDHKPLDVSTGEYSLRLYCGIQMNWKRAVMQKELYL